MIFKKRPILTNNSPFLTSMFIVIFCTKPTTLRYFEYCSGLSNWKLQQQLPATSVGSQGKSLASVTYVSDHDFNALTKPPRSGSHPGLHRGPMGDWSGG